MSVCAHLGVRVCACSCVCVYVRAGFLCACKCVCKSRWVCVGVCVDELSILSVDFVTTFVANC